MKKLLSLWIKPLGYKKNISLQNIKDSLKYGNMEIFRVPSFGELQLLELSKMLVHYFKKHFPFILSLILIFCLFSPIVPLFLSIFSPKNANFEHISSLFLFKHSYSTLFLILCVAGFAFLIAFSTSILVTFYKFPLSKLFRFLLILPLTVPTYFGAYIYDKTFDYSGIINSSARNYLQINHLLSFDLFSFWGGVWIFTLFLFPYLFIVLLSFFRKNIAELLEVARTLGTHPIKIITTIILPLSKLPIIAGLSMIIMEVINDFGVTSYLGIPTLTSSIFKAWFSMNDIQTASQISGFLIPVIFIMLISSKNFSIKNSVSFVATKDPSPIPLKGISAVLATGFCSVILFFSYILPLLILGYYSYFAIVQHSINDTVLVLGQTMLLMFVSTIILITLGLYVAYHNRERQIGWFTELFSLQYALPSIVIAVSILNIFFLLEKIGFTPSGSTITLQNIFLIVIFAYTMRFMIISYNLSNNAFKKMGLHYQEVARTLGYNKLQTFYKIELPIILPSLLIGSSILLIDLFKELPLTLFLSPFNFETATSRTYNYIANEMFTEATPSSLLLIVILTVLIYLIYSFSYSPKGQKK